MTDKKLPPDEMAAGFDELQMHSFNPTVMWVSDERMLKDMGLEPGTWLLQRGYPPVKVGEPQEFEKIAYSALFKRVVTKEELNQGLE